MTAPRGRAVALLAWLASACADTPPGPSLHDDGTTTDPATTGGITTGMVATGTPGDGTGSSTDETGPPDPVCGDEVVEVPEECDLGRLNGTGMYCTDGCLSNRCGDGYLGPGEVCDDGNQSDEDLCTSGCRLAACGDGLVQAREECDAGKDNATNGACLPGCIAAACGDGSIHEGVEACDGDTGAATCETLGYDGGALQCASDCLSLDTSNCHACPNGTLEPGEECDGADLGSETCASLLGAGYHGLIECYLLICEYDTSNCCLSDGDACMNDANCCSNWCTGPGICQPPP